MSTEWEYSDFGFNFDSRAEIGTAGKQISFSDIVQHTWTSEVRPQVLENLQEWLNDGWEPVTPINSDCMIVETQNAGFFGGTKVFLKGILIKMRRRCDNSSTSGKTQENDRMDESLTDKAAEEFRKILEYEIAKAIIDLAETGQITEEKMNSMAQDTLNLLQEESSIQDLIISVAVLQNEHPELKDVILSAMKEIKNKKG